MKPTSAAFLMPTIRGADTGSKKRYAGMIQEGDAQRMVFKGLETVRTDWTPLAQQFPTGVIPAHLPQPAVSGLCAGRLSPG